MPRKVWMFCLAAWFLLWGLLAVTNVKFDQSAFIMGVLAIVGAVFLAIDLARN